MPFTHNFDGFFKSVQKKLDKFEEKKLDICKGVSIQCLGDLQTESPVRHGRYRAAHTLTIMEPSNYVPPPNLTKAEYESLRLKQLLDARDKLGKINLKHGLKIWIVDIVDYATFIEDGSYTKHAGAPKQVYGRVAARFDRILKKELTKS